MNEFSTYEYVVAQKTEGKWILARIALIAFYILFTATLLLVGFFTRIIVPLLAFSVIGVWLLVFVTWLHFPGVWVKVAAQIAVLVGNYFISKLIIFKKK